jgi:hypothetical protein
LNPGRRAEPRDTVVGQQNSWISSQLECLLIITFRIIRIMEPEQLP